MGSQNAAGRLAGDEQLLSPLPAADAKPGSATREPGRGHVPSVQAQRLLTSPLPDDGANPEYENAVRTEP